MDDDIAMIVSELQDEVLNPVDESEASYVECTPCFFEPCWDAQGYPYIIHERLRDELMLRSKLPISQSMPVAEAILEGQNWLRQYVDGNLAYFASRPEPLPEVLLEFADDCLGDFDAGYAVEQITLEGMRDDISF